MVKNLEDALKLLHLSELKSLFPHEILSIFITLALSFLIGLEREEHQSRTVYKFGGVRTFPIMGICGYILAKLSNGHPIIIGMGFMVFGGLLWLSYRKKLKLSASSGMTSEVSGLFTYLVGALIFFGYYWMATTLVVTILLLLELKPALESLAKRIPPGEIFTFTRFLLISAVILPVVPKQSYTTLHINPYQTWLIVVVISCISYLAYLSTFFVGAKKSIILSAILGGIYSSTSTTVLLAKQSSNDKEDNLYTGSILIASSFMYFRLIILLFFFNAALAEKLLLPFFLCGLLFLAVGFAWTRLQTEDTGGPVHQVIQKRNPLELKTAILFALLFSLFGILTIYARKNLGISGVYALAGLTGLTDIDPFVMSLTQTTGSFVLPHTAAAAIILATVSNNFIKGFYTMVWAKKEVKKKVAYSMFVLGLAGLLTLLLV